MMTHFRASCSLIALMSLTAAPALADDFVRIPGGVADRAGKVGYVQSVKGGVDALDLTTGKVLWSFGEFARPVALVTKGLVVQIPEKGKANAVRLVVLDLARKGEAKKSVSKLIEFPDWVSVGTEYGRAFTSSARVDSQGRVILLWDARAWYAGGARPTPEVEKAARKNASGIFRVHVDTEAVEVLTWEQLPSSLPNSLEKITIKLEAGHQEAVALKGRVYYRLDTPRKDPRPMRFGMARMLLAVDGTTGAALWRHEVYAPPALPPLP